MPRQAEVKSLYYITHVDNVASILQHGILSHGQIESRGIPFKPVYDAEIVSRRKGKAAPDG
ncbi:MAG: DarT ssDNA thymidine ADP-ribosyltransferase family protein, partial [Thermoguttaceae bacterium]